jgi:hypothetical protein
MGLKKSGSAVYVRVYEGKLVRRFKAPTPECVERTTKENNVVYEEYFKEIEGKLVGIDVKPSEKYGERLLVYISDDTIYCIEMKLDSRYAVNFLKTLPNVNLNEPVVFKPNKKVENGKEDYTVFLSQKNKATGKYETLKRFYTKDNPNGIPEPTFEKGKRGKPDKWDFEAVNDFLYETVVVPFKDVLRAVNNIQLTPDDVIPGESDISEQ